jgi:hypothetical protein
MKKIFTIIILSVFILSGCKKDSTPHTSGTDKIDNTLYQATTYYAKGFSFANGGLVPTTATPLPDIVLYVNTDTQPSRITLQTAPQKRDSFSKVGDYTDAASAIRAFKNLTSVGSVTWIGTADPVEANQIWLYRTENDQYAKIRIVTVINEVRGSLPYGEITFEWVFQPDGSPNFPVE